MNNYRLFSGGFGRNAFAVLEPDGYDATPLPTVDPTTILDAVIGAAQILAPTQHGMRVTGVEASVDSRNDYNRGLRLILLSFPGNSTALAALVQLFNVGLGLYNVQTAAGPKVDGAVWIDPEQPILNRPAPGLWCHLDHTIPPRTTGGDSDLIGAVSGSMNVPTKTDLVLSFTGRGIEIPPDRSLVALFTAYRAFTGAALVAGDTLTNAQVRGSIQGFALTAADVGGGAFPEATTPARFGNRQVL